MLEQIKVHVIKYPDRHNLVMRYLDPCTGRQVQRSAKTAKHSEAVKAAGKWEAELREGRYQRSARMAWDEFREYYEDATLELQKTSTVLNYASTMNAFELVCRPDRLENLNTARVTMFAIELRKGIKRTLKDGTVRIYTLSEASVARHLRHLKAIARWAHRQDLLPKLPKFDMPGKASGAQRMKGRPIVLEEFERMLAAVESVCGPEAAESWKFFLHGLWTSGLRLGECINLRWDYRPGEPAVILDGKHSVLVFDGESQKSGKTQHVPLAPEAVELLEPHARCHGYVFHPLRRDGKPMARRTLRIGKRIGAIGAAAGVITDPDKGQTATAHDLRRAFGSRWSKLVMPATLKELMRHASIETTMTYYVQQSAQVTSSELWAARKNLGTNLGTSQQGGRRRRQKSSGN